MRYLLSCLLSFFGLSWLMIFYRRLIEHGKPRKLALRAAIGKLLAAFSSVGKHASRGKGSLRMLRSQPIHVLRVGTRFSRSVRDGCPKPGVIFADAASEVRADRNRLA